MKFRRDAPLALITAVVVVIGVLTLASNLLFGGMTSAVEKSQIDLMRSIITFNLEGTAGNALARAEIIASEPEVRDALARGDRPALLSTTEAMFATQKDKYGVTQVQFHTPPATSFLRLQAPTRFGDDLSSFRPIVVAVNRERTPKKGMETARSGPAIFGVAPISAPDGSPAGSVEVGMDFGPVLDRLKAAYGLDLTLFLDEAPLRQTATGMDPTLLAEQNRVGSTIKLHSTDWDLMRDLVTVEDLRIHDEPSDYVRKAGGKPYGVVIVPVRGASGELLGAVAVTQSFAPTRGAAGRSLVLQILFALFAAIVLAGTVLIVVRGFLLRPLRAISGRFAAIGTDDSVEDDPDDDRLSLEMSELAAEQKRIAALVEAGRNPAP
ncbi:cache domain-containing protein [Brevundimonas sp.]|uniref:cache domain-containing protein n=1 Tax=Brevundimonas sp. TaxID=1871086 RepID=UPI001A33FFCB|nr:cache domain-containing protein [Brevundimonas sp.]MBJ7484094.1 hypothetical protein [Brevundimonas sp.]